MTENKKQCTFCGCYHDGEDDICIVCLDELYGSDPGEVEYERN